MKQLIITALFLAPLFCAAQSWDKLFETAFVDYRNGQQMYRTELTKTTSFTQDEFYTIEDHCLQNEVNIFRIEFNNGSGALTFYHRGNIDGSYLELITEEAIGDSELHVMNRQSYNFETTRDSREYKQ